MNLSSIEKGLRDSEISILCLTESLLESLAEKRLYEKYSDYDCEIIASLPEHYRNDIQHLLELFKKRNSLHNQFIKLLVGEQEKLLVEVE